MAAKRKPRCWICKFAANANKSDLDVCTRCSRTVHVNCGRPFAEGFQTEIFYCNKCSAIVEKESDDRKRVPARKPTWKQLGPRDQLVGLISAAQGDLMNLAEGDTGDPKKAAIRAGKFLEECQQILRMMPEDRWPEPPKPIGTCPDTGEPHVYTPDEEYDPTGNTINCENCGELKP